MPVGDETKRRFRGQSRSAKSAVQIASIRITKQVKAAVRLSPDRGNVLGTRRPLPCIDRDRPASETAG
jgi:hypothetical protein